MKVSAVVALLISSSEAISVDQVQEQDQSPISISQQMNKIKFVYPFGENTYNDIRSQELKCIADRNKEWKYDAATNTGSCPLKSFTPYVPYTPDHDIRAQVSLANGWTYPFGQDFYNDIRSQELKCLADRNKEWKYDGATNTGSCTLKSYTPYVPHVVENDIRAQKPATNYHQVSTALGEWTYPFGQNSYNDIRAQELKCLANRNFEWHYDGATNVGSCTKNSYSPYVPYVVENDIRAQKNVTLAHVATKTADGWTYPFGRDFYNDIRSQELKCLADRNSEWKYDGATNTGSCLKKSYSPYVPFVPENDIRAQKQVNATTSAVAVKK